MTISTYIYNLSDRPSKFSFLVAIPFNMYRIQTYKYTDGLNFFQRAVLKFKARPEFNAISISDIMDVDPRLIEIVIRQLKDKKLIDDNGLLTDDGLACRNSSMGVVVDNSEKKIGHVFQMCDRDEYYPFYVDEINPVQSYIDYKKQVGIIFEAEDREKDFRSHVLVLDIDEDATIQSPSDLQVLQLMENGCRSRGNLNESLSESYRKCDKLKMEFLPDDAPEKVYVCTYVYLEPLGNNYFDKEWRVSDPFIEDTYSPTLKFYLESLNSKTLKDYMLEKFKNALTQGHATWNQSEKDLNEEVDKLLAHDFDSVPNIDIDENQNFKTFLRVIVEYFIKNKISGYKRKEISHMIILYTQRLVELVFEIDNKENNTLYTTTLNNTFKAYSRNKSGQIKYDKHGNPIRCDKNLKGDADFIKKIKDALDTILPSRPEMYYKLEGISKNFLNKDGIIKKIFVLLICSATANDNALMRMFAPHLKFVLEKCGNRNIGSHGTLANDILLTEKENDEYYEFVRKFVNDYSKYRNSKR